LHVFILVFGLLHLFIVWPVWKIRSKIHRHRELLGWVDL
jgi:hypothetical protein